VHKDKKGFAQKEFYFQSCLKESYNVPSPEQLNDFIIYLEVVLNSIHTIDCSENLILEFYLY